MPVESGFVSVGIDDQNLDLLLDSGFWGIAVLDGDWYKKTFGKYACRKRRQGCYFCPREDPCVFEGDEPSENLQFADGKILKCIMRSGKLVLESQGGSEFPFRVCRGISWDDETRPTGLFGISMVPPTSERYQGLASTESTLEMLVRYNFTGRRSYTLQTIADRISKFISGELTLGGALDEQEAKQHLFPEFAVNPETHAAFAAVWVSSVELFGAGRKLKAREPLSRRHPPSFLAIIDTGTSGISLPCPVLIDEMESVLRMGLRKERYGDAQITQMYTADEEKLVYVQEEAFDSLPVMGLRLRGESHSMRVDIHLKH
ncbi:hypothetical protein FOZ63_029492 [Perkinsus olseni]|uniref:Peptidase A1 domain-containing protein n=1 Tax=Perkinsus olseni TaxID=32597 RepID=A0A7J6Q8Q6_PEROL|nr:hypothetical protein FOZ63_029492 [Perkinsus olseni]